MANSFLNAKKRNILCVTTNIFIGGHPKIGSCLLGTFLEQIFSNLLGHFLFEVLFKNCAYNVLVETRHGFLFLNGDVALVGLEMIDLVFTHAFCQFPREFLAALGEFADSVLDLLELHFKFKVLVDFWTNIGELGG